MSVWLEVLRKVQMQNSRSQIIIKNSSKTWAFKLFKFVESHFPVRQFM